MKHRSEGATALLGMPEFVVGAQLEVDDEVWLHVETTDDVVGCSSCGTRAVGHGRRRVKVRDLPIAGRNVVLVWSKRIWRCPDPDCDVSTWSERCSCIASRASVTESGRAEICRRVGQDEDSVAQVARDFGIGWHAAMTAVRDHGQPLVDDPERLAGVTGLGVDETTMLHANASRRTAYVTGFVDLERGRLLDVRPGRTGRVVADWLDEQGADWRAAIGAVAMDGFRGYANGLLAQLGHATVVLDHFHAIKLANDTIGDARRRVQKDRHGRRGRAKDPLWANRRLLLVAADRLTPNARERLETALAAGDPTGELRAAWVGKELLRDVYAAADLASARRALVAFYEWCADADTVELRRLATTIAAWEDEVLAFHTTGLSNGPTEAVNLLIEKVRRIGHGFRSFENYRLRLLLRCGVQWQDRTAARIRGRHPRLVA